MNLKNKYNGIVQTEKELYNNYLEEIKQDGLTENQYPFKKWINDLLDTNEYEIIK